MYAFLVGGFNPASFLPGVCQTAFRAEVYAIGYTLHWAAAMNAPVRIWTDCLGVVTKFRLLVWGSKRLNVNHSNADLWAWILQSVETLGKHRVSLRKVAAHRSLKSARSLHEAWMFVHNDYADRAARMANQARPPCFWRFWEQHVQATAATEKLCQQVTAVHLEVGKRHAHSSVNDTGEPAVVVVRATREFPVRFRMGAWSGDLPPLFAQMLGPHLARKMTQWFFHRLTAQHGGEPIWVSFTQLYLDFQLTWGHPGPLKVHGRWVDASHRPHLAPEVFAARLRTKWFRQCVKALLRETGMDAALDQCRPASDMIQAYVQAISVPWDAAALAEVELWLARTLVAPCVRSANVLACLPLAAQSGTMRIVAE